MVPFYRNKQGLLPMDYVKSSTAREQLLLAASMAKENAAANDGNVQPKFLVRIPLHNAFTF